MSKDEKRALVRAGMAWSLRQDGLTYEQIGKKLSVSRERATQLVRTAEREFKEQGEDYCPFCLRPWSW